ncbi:DNA-directed DNA polymerase [Diatrype stigma]|uniref:DNA-directed DNA polymerase n=1 Tax=Diatrype stigma TaxID=117547 RepID=A0AAN9U6H4_9PEZI
MGKSNKRKREAKASGANGSQPSQKRTKTAQPDKIQFEGDLNAPTSQHQLDKSPFPEKPSPEDRKREAATYELLGSADLSERLAAADALITGLLGGEDSEASPEPVLERHLEKRLFRGLASSRNASRVGFSLVLTVLLGELFGPKNLAGSKYPGLTFDKVLAILVEKTQASGSAPGQEERDAYFGQLFGLQCFVEAKILFDDTSRWAQVLDLLLKLADKKVWLRSQCGWVIVESLPQMGQEKAEETLKKLADIGLGKTAEGVGIWLKARNCYPRMKLPPKPWKDPLAAGSLSELARVLKENVRQDTGEDATVSKIKQGNWTAQLHFVWDLILESFTHSGESGKSHDKGHFKLFWNTVVDDGLFSKHASDGQKFRGFMIFRTFLDGLRSGHESLVKDLFTRNLMTCLMNQAAKEDRYLHLAAVKTLKSVEQCVENSPGLLVPILKELFGKFGTYGFDQRTNSKTVEKLLQWTTPTNVETVLQLIREPVVVMDKSEEGEVDNLRQIYAHYLFKLTTQAKPDSESIGDKVSVIELGIAELASCAYSKQAQFKPALSEKTREVFRSRLSSAFARLTKRREDFAKLCDAILSIDTSAVTMSDEVSAECSQAIKAMRKLLKASKKSNKKDADTSIGLALLYAITILQLYDGAADAISILHDLQSCSEKVQTSDAGTSELLVEILLSLVSRPSAMMRQVSQQVFEAFTAQMSPEALQLLADPLLAEENTKGYQALFENLEDEEMIDADGSDQSDDDGDDVEEDDISEIGSDVEFVTLNGEGAEEDEGGDEENDDEDDEQAEADAQELAELDDALAKVLKSHRLDKDEDAQSSDNDSDMTDSEMMALDEKLGEVFRQRAKKVTKKSEKKDQKETVLNFKRRALDLLDIYVKHEAANPVAFSIILPLLQLVRTTGDKPLANKATNTILDFTKALKKARNDSNSGTSEDQAPDSSNGGSGSDEQLKLLRDIHHEAAQEASHAFARAASAASLLIASSLFSADKENIRRIAAVYADTQADWIMGRIRVQPVIFSDWTNWCQSQAQAASSVHQQQK